MIKAYGIITIAYGEIQYIQYYHQYMFLTVLNVSPCFETELSKYFTVTIQTYSNTTTISVKKR